MAALAMGFEPNQAAGIAIIGGADGPTAIFLSSKVSPMMLFFVDDSYGNAAYKTRFVTDLGRDEYKSPQIPSSITFKEE